MASTSTNRARCFCGTSCGILPAAVTRHVCKQTDRWCDARFLRTRAGWYTRAVVRGYADTPHSSDSAQAGPDVRLVAVDNRQLVLRRLTPSARSREEPKMSTKFAKTTIGLARHQKSAVYYYSPKYTIGSAFRRAGPLGEYLLGTRIDGRRRDWYGSCH